MKCESSVEIPCSNLHKKKNSKLKSLQEFVTPSRGVAKSHYHRYRCSFPRYPQGEIPEPGQHRIADITLTLNSTFNVLNCWHHTKIIMRAKSNAQENNAQEQQGNRKGCEGGGACDQWKRQNTCELVEVVQCTVGGLL